ASRGCWLNSFVHRTFGSRRSLNDLTPTSEVAPLALRQLGEARVPQVAARGLRYLDVTCRDFAALHY
ncbi:MAG: hypothetical protein KK476_13375, partial [Sinorhizobium fredii]|nr:hypothetical protein [Sinorhizobium fredii]